MKKYIDKSEVVAEINRVLNSYDTNEITSGRYALVNLRDFLNTLETKEVILEKEIEEVKHNYKVDDNRHTSICSADIDWLAQHFFELGLKAQKGE